MVKAPEALEQAGGTSRRGGPSQARSANGFNLLDHNHQTARQTIWLQNISISCKNITTPVTELINRSQRPSGIVVCPQTPLHHSIAIVLELPETSGRPRSSVAEARSVSRRAKCSFPGSAVWVAAGSLSLDANLGRFRGDTSDDHAL